MQIQKPERKFQSQKKVIYISLVAYFKLKLDFKELALIESVFEHRAHPSS